LGHNLAGTQARLIVNARGGFVQQAVLIWDKALADYDLGDGHPLNPVRLTLTVELMQAFGLLGDGVIIKPRPATEDELTLVHSSGYVETVLHAGDWNSDFRPAMGLGTDDNPVYPGMHEIASLTAGASIAAVDEVLSGRALRSFSIAGGMHHAHRGQAAGFSVYNDAAIAIAAARKDNPGLKVLYIDIDAHHGDGVHEAFASSPEVLTISIHESGLYTFPGTGFPAEIGYDGGAGFSANVPLPAYATDECFVMAFDEVAVPLARAFAPDLIVAQLGADSHHADPQTELGMTIPGYRAMVDRIIGLADELCEGRLVTVGGGGYHIIEVVPLVWTWVLARLEGVELPDEVPQSWRTHVRELTGHEAPTSMGARDAYDSPAERTDNVRALTAHRIAEVREAVFPYHGLQP
jgi:acetoin utilization protein AcuC